MLLVTFSRFPPKTNSKSQSIAQNACCKEHVLSQAHIDEVCAMINDYEGEDGKTNAQNRFALYRESVRLLLQRGYAQYKVKHNLPAVMTNSIRSKYPK